MKSIGILGGGQLSRILSLKAKERGLKAFVLSAGEQDPAAQNNPFWIKGDPNKARDLKKIFQTADIVTFESEFFPAKKIQSTLDGLKGPKPFVAPSLKALSLIQDRLAQKKLLQKYKIQTADFFKVPPVSQNKPLNLWKNLGPFVLKSRTGGYDGHGTFIFKKPSQIKKASFPKGSFIVEKFVPFKRELALLSARNKRGEIIFFPLVETFQKNSICLWVKGPAHHKQLPALKRQIEGFLKGINYQGLMAFELFDTGPALMVNELAPRVHNSGHYSLSALSEDQFTVHLKAVLNQPLIKPKKLKKAFAMLNLLGEGAKKPSWGAKGGKKIYLKNMSPEPFKIKKDIFLWWYGKSLSRKGRKMGHINSLANTPNQVLNKLIKIRYLFKI